MEREENFSGYPKCIRSVSDISSRKLIRAMPRWKIKSWLICVAWSDCLRPPQLYWVLYQFRLTCVGRVLYFPDLRMKHRTHCLTSIARVLFFSDSRMTFGTNRLTCIERVLLFPDPRITLETIEHISNARCSKKPLDVHCARFIFASSRLCIRPNPSDPWNYSTTPSVRRRSVVGNISAKYPFQSPTVSVTSFTIVISLKWVINLYLQFI